ncbi:tail fiber assembly protein [Enterobacter roggenkampii]|uniref:tail fiber assembly protein n=1 Tax=Enterobacter roggenkampii TaxID=1812935 RepID=UPI000BA83EA1|nr:tail fiber assembly protein [Enterobacter roggenkampii]PAO24604.1 hypothetical protein CIW56_01355 [Enterobacter roggenkampii]
MTDFNYYYSSKSNAFYLLSLKNEYESSATGWPDDAVGVNDDDYKTLMTGLGNGQIIVPGHDGYPVLEDRPPVPQEELILEANSTKASLIQSATNAIAPLQDAVELGIATDEEIAQLKAWKKYRVEVNRVDTSTAPDITWPEPPES